MSDPTTRRREIFTRWTTTSFTLTRTTRFKRAFGSRRSSPTTTLPRTSLVKPPSPRSRLFCKGPSRPSPSFPIQHLSTGIALWARAISKTPGNSAPRSRLRGGIRFESTNGWNEAHGRASQYGFTNGVINTTPTTGNSALSDNRAKFLPEPRVGIAWNVFGNGKTSLRSSVGLHHSLLDNLDYRLDQAAPYNTTLSYANVPIASPVSGAPGLISPSNVQTNIATPAVVSYTLSIEQQLDRATSITIGYVGSHGYQQILSEDQNEPASIICSAASTCPAGTTIGTIYYPTIVKANPLVANTTSWISGGSSNYNALEVDLRRNLLHGLQLRANYTYAKNLDNGSAWNTSVSANTPAFVSYPANPSLDYGPAATDVRHLAAFNATYELPIGHGQTLLSSASRR